VRGRNDSGGSDYRFTLPDTLAPDDPLNALTGMIVASSAAAASDVLCHLEPQRKISPCPMRPIAAAPHPLHS